MQRFAVTAVLAIFALASGAGCGGYVKPRPHILDARAQSFLESRSQPPASVPAATEAVDKATETVDLTGAVERPGKLALEPSLQTLRQALDAAGGATPTAELVRIRPADDVVSKLFAEDGGNGLIEIPLAALGDTPVYLRAGDVIEVAALENSPAAGTPAAAAPANPPTDVAAPVAPPAPVAATPVASPAPQSQSTAPQPLTAKSEQDAAIGGELAKVRAEFEGKLATLRAEIEKLQQDQAKWIARLERAQPTTTAPVSAKAASKPASVAAMPEKSVPSAKTESRSEEPQPSTRPATVLVSGSVKSPGMYPIDEVKTVGGAVRAAGDRGDANLSAVEVRPEGQRGALVGMGLGLGAAPAKTVVNVEPGKGGDVPLRGGEVIFVPASPRSEQVR